VLPSSLAVVVIGLVLCGGALVGFSWAWSRGHFGELEAQGRVILTDRDLRLERPWEPPEQQAEREARYGSLLPPYPGEWGGAS
jgi:nitrogen fixation-related uncharacterized protein